MIWVSWRQTRAGGAALLAVSACLAAYLVAAGLRVRKAYDSTGVGSCVRVLDPPAPSPCFTALGHFHGLIGASWYGGGGAFLLYLSAVPGLFGAFIGAPLLTREYEHGTNRLAWTQSVTRRRWLAHRLLIAGGITVLAALLVSTAATFARSPIDRLDGHFRPESFNLEGVAPIGFAVFALTLGVAVGALLRRTVPAIAITLIVYTGVQVLVQTVRPHYLPPKSAAFSAGDSSSPTGGRGSWVLNYGFEHTTYQPAGRFWTFQLIELGIYLCLSAALVALAVRLIRRPGGQSR